MKWIGALLLAAVFAVLLAFADERHHTGDKVRFSADRIDGQYTVTRIEVAK